MSLFNGEQRRMASTITAFPLQPMDIRTALEVDLIDNAGRLQRHIYAKMVGELEDAGARWVRPHEQAAQPAPRARW
jgi:hypothetical protein